MSQPPRPESAIDLAVFNRNQAKAMTLEYLKPYWGKQVAWSADGTAIVAAADGHEELQARLRELGINPYHVVYGFVDDPNIVQI
jgi:hypothetical protein